MSLHQSRSNLNRPGGRGCREPDRTSNWEGLGIKAGSFFPNFVPPPRSRQHTMVFAVLDPASRTLTFANAGHPWPLFVNGDPHVLQTASGLPLGIVECKFDDYCITLPKGSRVLLYSDGMTEACNANGEEYGIKRLCRHAANEEISPETVLDDVRAFARSIALGDDAKMIVVRAD